MSQEWENENVKTVIDDSNNPEIEDLRRTRNTLDILVKKRASTNNLKQAIKSVLSYHMQIELAFQSAKMDLLYTAAKGNTALKLNRNSFSKIEGSFKKIQDMEIVIQLCRACGIFQHEQDYFNALLSTEFETEKTQNSLAQTIRKVMMNTLDEYTKKLLNLEKRETHG